MEPAPLLLIRQRFPSRALADIPGEVRRQLSESGIGARLAPGSRVAIGVGSRGISNIAEIVRAAVDFWIARGMRPFLFPAMGSHGAATPEGQNAVLAHFGITETAMGCPIVSQLQVVPAGVTPEGIEAVVDRAALESDGILLIGRVKWHTDFSGQIESGLFKMMAIGLGKFDGARRYHTAAYRLGLERVIRSIGRQVLATGKILGGLAILEDACHQTAAVCAVPVEEMEEREQQLLATVKSWMGRIPFDLDILVVDEMGKNYSGAGMDTKVINRGVYGETNAWPGVPRMERVYVRDLSAKSYGNAVGIGMADAVHQRLLAKIDWNATRINSITSHSLPCIRTPIAFASDREALETLSCTVGRWEASEVTAGWIRNTLDLSSLALTANLRAAVEANPDLEIVGELPDWPFNEKGDLPALLPVGDRGKPRGG